VDVARITQGLFGIQLTLLGILVVLANGGALGLLFGGIGVLVSLISLFGRTTST
jgi:hypothetical protein